MVWSFMLGTEIVAAVFLIVCLCGCLYENPQRDRKTHWFAVLDVILLVALFSDSIAYYFDEHPGGGTVQFIANLISLTSSCFLVSAFAYYLHALASEKKNGITSIWLAHIVTIVNGLAVLLTIVETFLGNVFIVDGMFYGFGDWYPVCIIVSSLSTLYLMILSLLNREALGRHDTLAILLYSIIPLLSVIALMFCEGYSFTYVSAAVALSIVYVMLQSGKIAEMELRQDILNELSYNDPLTGLPNRRAYNEALETVSEKENVGVAFCDLNGLKHVNDSQGHKAGDEYLVRFANLLRDHFPEESIYRISGDEFVIVVFGVNREEFDRMLENFRKDVMRNEHIAAVGVVHGKSETVLELIKQAEVSMYEDKKLFYRSHPLYERYGRA